jgi:UPF0716 family protein affecting phage T7 exclusion
VSVFYFLMVASGFAMTNYGFFAASRSRGASSLLGAATMMAGIALTFGGLLLWLVPGFFS